MIVTIILTLVSCVMIASYLKLSTHDARLTRISIDEEKAAIAAEAGLDYGVMKLKEEIMWYQLSPAISQPMLQARLDAIAPPVMMGNYVYQTLGGQTAFRIQIETPVITGTITNGTACRGSYGQVQQFSVTCGAMNTNSGASSVMKQTVQAVGLCIIRFGVFYNDDLEILPGPTMTFQGPVHANGNLYLGGPLQFYDRVTAHGDIFHRRKDTDDRPGEAKVLDAYGNMVSMKEEDTYYDSDHEDWLKESLERWQGNIMANSHGVPELSPPIDPMDDEHDIIERALATNHPSYNTATEAEKFNNKAALRIHVEADGDVVVTDFYTNDLSLDFSNVVLRASGDDYEKDGSTSAYLFDTNMHPKAVYDVKQTDFYDAREGCIMAPVDIYVDRLLSVYPDLHQAFSKDEGRGIVYVTRDDSDGVTNGVKPCVRLRNGRTIDSPFGLSVVTDLPMYIEGDFNTVNVKPTLVAGDAVTMLSKAWQDSDSQGGESVRVPVDTEFRTVVMTGNMATTVGGYNGGLENVLRFLERWSGKTVTFRGSIIDLWYSELATGDWHYGTYDGTFRYKAPNRDWGYDDIYRTQSPPGMTHVFGMEEISWKRSTFTAEGW